MKTSVKSSGKQVLGVMVDGTDLRIAHMGWEKGQIVIYGLDSIALPMRLGRLRTTSAPQPAMLGDDDGDVFGFDEKPELDEISDDVEVEGQEVSGLLINVFTKYPLKKAKIAVNIPEGQATYYSFNSDFGLKGKKLTKRLADEISPLTGGALDSAIIDHFRSKTEGLMVVVAEGNIPVVEELIDIKSFLSGGMPYFCQVSSNEIALVNLVRMALDPVPDQITAVIYIGCDFSRVILMKGSDPISFIQSIHEGYHSPQVCQTLFSKILLEQEEAGIPEIDRIVLAGEIGMTHAFNFFTKQFPEADVQPVTPGPLDTSLLKNEEIAIFPNFAIPVALAWEALEKKTPKFIRLDLLPRSIRESQRVFKIAWHGVVLLGAIFVFMLLLSYQGFTSKNSIQSLKDSIQHKQAAIEAMRPELNHIAQLQEQVTSYKANLGFLDEIIVDPDKWSRLFAKLTEDFRTVNRIWIDHIESKPGGFMMIGKALSRDRVPALAAGFDGVSLKRVTRSISESGTITYEFEINAQIPPPLEPELPSSEAISTDRAAATKGSIEAKPEKSKAPGKTAPPPEKKKEPVAKATPEKKEESKPAPVAQKRVQKAESPKSKPGSEPPKAGAADKSQKQIQPQTQPDKTAQQPAVKSPPTQASAKSYYTQGLNLVRGHDIDGALKEFRTLLQNYPDSKEAPATYYWIGECHYSQKSYGEAAKAFEASLKYERTPKREAGMMMLGMSYLKLGRKNQAKLQFEALLKAYPEGEYTDTAQRKLKELAG